ncbi:MAG: hypothetical protein BGO69_07260 [Bacteroidetes bacterium 46-16]|nr:MAG: hypothetical protein BGO69_07260 [Bacteroidetes bacterium 46-16]
MKKIALILTAAVLSVSLLQSCDKVKEEVKANVDLQSTEVSFDIPMINSTNDNTAMGTFSATINVDSIIKAANAKLGAGNITSAKIKSMSIQLTNSDDSTNFSNLESCTASFSTDAKQDMIVIASVSNNPDVPASYLELSPNTDLELKDYFNATTFNYTLTGKARRITGHSLHALATVKYGILVGL